MRLLLLVPLAFAADRRWNADADGDGFGDPLVYTVADAATPPAGYVSDTDDCDDGDAAVNPDAVETCNAVDDDCDGDVDSEALCGVPMWQWSGHGYLLVTDAAPWPDAQATCLAYGYTLTAISSDAEDAALDVAVDAVSTGKWWTGFNDREYEGQWVWSDGSDGSYTNWYAGEPNNGLGGGEEDCAPLNRFHPARGWNDEPCENAFAFVCESGELRTMYQDADGDGFGDGGSANTRTSRDVTEGYADNADDCDDGDDRVNPAALEVWYDGVDGDCDGHDDDDADFDGHRAAAAGGDDCDDAASAVHPGAADTWYDGVDHDCSGSDHDQDGDGADAPSGGGNDCDDTDPAIGPQATDLPDNGVDEDCDGHDATAEDTGAADTGDDSGAEDSAGDTAPTADPDPAPPGACGCAAGPPARAALALALAGLLAARRRTRR